MIILHLDLISTMKNLLYILTGILIIISCEQKAKSKTENQPSVKTVELIVEGLKKEDFKIVKKGDTTFYLKQAYEGIDGKEITFNEKEFKDVEAKVKFDFSFIQYINDDNPASPLSFRKESEWSGLKVNLGSIKIPSFQKSTSTIQVHEVLGLSTNKDLVKWIESTHFKEIRKESFDVQTKLYQLIIDTKETYEECCPEYLEEANAFLQSQIEDYNTTEELGLELVYKELTIEITGALITGEKFRKVIIEK
jgi:hypothetical protein